MSSSDRRYRGYRADTIRLDGWDYRRSAWYFITICTHNRIPYFGRVRNGIMGLSAVGCVAAQFWKKIPDLQDHAVIDEYVVMPNHVHGLLGLLTTINNDQSTVETLHCNVSTANGSSSNTDEFMSHISPKAGSVSTIIRSYKSAVTRWARQNGVPDFAWQSRFYDRIVRTREELQTIRRYIHNNPATWADDRNHPSR